MTRITSGVGGKVMLVALGLALATSGAVAQEWSAAQKDVWKSVEAYWDLAAKENLDGFMGYFHADYSGWSNQAALPGDKATTRKWVGHDFDANKTVLYEIKPVAIKIHGNVAIAHYYYATVEQDAKGEEKTIQGRWTDVLMKQGDRWVLIGDHGGRTGGS